MNFALTSAALRPNVIKMGNDVSFTDNCKWEQALKSMPNAVFIALGVVDTYLQDFTEESYMKDYKNMVSNLTALPTKPEIFLVTPSKKCDGDPN